MNDTDLLRFGIFIVGLAVSLGAGLAMAWGLSRLNRRRARSRFCLKCGLPLGSEVHRLPRERRCRSLSAATEQGYQQGHRYL